ncbi:MCE family protein [Antrihabitans cavernicola]|uniref:MCE family protein n=1 Tax=Antrihabitans cavernicola TaxID=2495913 RepID=A0A5A7S6C4_9NOCA|nr:MlaD family protein [Spelaeibacter cavernicola]KAA0019436.1 MCE family protein [Spelaeibacter cavernicola]
MSIRKPLIGFSLFAILAILVTWVIWSTLQRSVDGDTSNYGATFSDVSGLKVGDDVRMAGVRVGRINDIELDGKNNAKVDFIVQSNQHLYANTKALVRYQNLIGQRYVALAPGAGDAAPLPAGGSIPIEQTEPSFDISVLLGGFEPLFSVLRPEQINDLSETLVQALQGDGVSLGSFITQAAALAATFSQRDAIIGDVITNLSGVLTGLANRSDQLDSLIAQTKTLVGGLYDQGKSLLASTEQVASATTSLVDMVAPIKPAIQNASMTSSDALTMLINHGAQLDRTANEVTPLLTDLARFTGEGAYANAYICALDVSLWGVLLPRGVFPAIGNAVLGNAHSEVCR